MLKHCFQCSHNRLLPTLDKLCYYNSVNNIKRKHICHYIVYTILHNNYLLKLVIRIYYTHTSFRY